MTSVIPLQRSGFIIPLKAAYNPLWLQIGIEYVTGLNPSGAYNFRIRKPLRFFVKSSSSYISFL